MNYAEIKYIDIANGEGIRTSLFVSGCRHKCKECFNEIAWDFEYGDKFTDEMALKIIESCAPEYVSGLTILGGEPLEPENQGAVLNLVKEFKRKYENKTVWLYTGFIYEDIIGNPKCRANTERAPEILDCVDVLVDGPFIKDEYNISLKFKGSANQRLIDVKKTRELGAVTCWESSPELRRN